MSKILQFLAGSLALNKEVIQEQSSAIRLGFINDIHLDLSYDAETMD